MADASRVSAISPFSEDDLPQYLKQYYKYFFPFKEYYRWLSYGYPVGMSSYFAKREFSFTLKNDIYIRYQSFSTLMQMQTEIRKRCPYKIDIGAVFTYMPKFHKMIKPEKFCAKQKELVFDIDMTDYDAVRICCSGANICNRCWPLMNVAMKIIDKALEDDFGFQHRLWVYSGRRGVHCWVCDDAARKLAQNARSAIAEYLTVIKGGEYQVKKVNLSSKLHPALMRASKIVDAHFEALVLDSQEILAEKESWANVLALIPDEEIHKKLNASWEANTATSRQRWAELVKELDDSGKMSLNSCANEIKFQYCYPRLDVNVTKGLNHLLKSPFCIHPKTGRVCIPIDIKKVDQFDPLKVPTVSEICQSFDEYLKSTEKEEKIIVEKEEKLGEINEKKPTEAKENKLTGNEENKLTGNEEKKLDENEEKKIGGNEEKKTDENEESKKTNQRYDIARYKCRLLEGSIKVFKDFLQKLETENSQRSREENERPFMQPTDETDQLMEW